MTFLRVILLSNLFSHLFLLKQYSKQINIRTFLISIILGAPTLLTIYSAYLDILRKPVSSTNLGVVASLLICISAAFFLALNSPKKVHQRPKVSLMFLVFLSIYATLIGLLLQQSFLVSLGILIIQLLAYAWHVSVVDLFLGSVLSLLNISISILLLSFELPVTSPCRVDKCLLFKNVLSDLLGGNGLSLDLAMLMSLAISSIFFKSKHFIIFSLNCSLLILMTSSRIGIASFAFFMILYFAKSVLKNNFMFISCLFSVMIYSSYPIWGKFTEKAFTERGYLWLYAKSILGQVGLVGFGTSYWSRLGNSRGFPSNYGTHNIWFDILISLGYLGLIIVVGFLFSLFRTLKRVEYRILLMSFIFSGMNESTLILWKLYPVSLIVVFLSVISQRDKLPP